MNFEKIIVNEVSVCFSRTDAKWGFEKNGQFKEFVCSRDCTFVLPLLEKRYSEVKTIIENLIVDKSLGDITFPYSLIIQAGLEVGTSSKYWPELAIRWINEDAPVGQPVLLALGILSKDLRQEQKFRHRLAALYNRMNRQNTF